MPAGGTSHRGHQPGYRCATNGTFTLAPFNIQTWSGLAIDPTSGHLWLGAVNGGAVNWSEYQIGAGGSAHGSCAASTSPAQGINQNEISGLSFDSTGKLWIASTQGEIYKVVV